MRRGAPTSSLPRHLRPQAARQNGLHMSTPAVSVIVPMRNAAEHVLEQVSRIGEPNGGGDRLRGDLGRQRLFGRNPAARRRATRGDDRMRVVSAPEVRSSYFARNQGVALAQADLLLFCDADDVVDQHWVQSMASALDHLDVVGGALKLDGRRNSGGPAEPVHRLPSGRRRQPTSEFAGARSRLSVASTA